MLVGTSQVELSWYFDTIPQAKEGTMKSFNLAQGHLIEVILCI
jgi:hypothetical protein